MPKKPSGPGPRWQDEPRHQGPPTPTPGTLPEHESWMEREVASAKAFRKEVWRDTYRVCYSGSYSAAPASQRYQPRQKGAQAASHSVSFAGSLDALSHETARPAPDETEEGNGCWHFAAVDDAAAAQEAPLAVSAAQTESTKDAQSPEQANSHNETRNEKPTVKRPVVSVINGDCLDVAQSLAARGLKPLVLNAASGGHFGGNYRGGSRAQEEELCRRSTLAAIVDPGLGYQRRTDLYPLPRDGGLHVPGVRVFRSGVQNGYKLMPDGGFECGIYCAAATKRPPLTRDKSALQEGPCLDSLKAVLRSFFLTAAKYGYGSVVAVPIGCGAFRNPAAHVSRLMADIVAEMQQLDRPTSVQEVVISVLDDHNSHHEFNPEGNFVPFAREFASRCGASVATEDRRNRTAIGTATANQHQQAGHSSNDDDDAA